MNFPNRACRDKPTDLFFGPDRVAEALRVCSKCEHQIDCALHFINEKQGVFGVSERSRRRLRGLMRDGTLGDEVAVANFIRRANRTGQDGNRAKGLYIDWQTQPDAWFKEIREVRANEGTSFENLAMRFEVSKTVVERIVKGEYRPEAGGPLADLPTATERARVREERRAIYRLYAEGHTPKDIADMLGVSYDRAKSVCGAQSLASVRREVAMREMKATG